LDFDLGEARRILTSTTNSYNREEGHGSLQKSIRKVKIQLKCYSHEELTWELEDTMQEAYPFLFFYRNYVYMYTYMVICTKDSGKIRRR